MTATVKDELSRVAVSKVSARKADKVAGKAQSAVGGAKDAVRDAVKK